MHTLTISIQGAANDSTSVELPDDTAWPGATDILGVASETCQAHRDRLAEVLLEDHRLDAKERRPH